MNGRANSAKPNAPTAGPIASSSAAPHRFMSPSARCERMKTNTVVGTNTAPAAVGE